MFIDTVCLEFLIDICFMSGKLSSVWRKKDDVYSTACSHCHVHLLHNWLFVFLLFFGHCVDSSSKYSICIPLWYLQTFLNKRMSNSSKMTCFPLSFVRKGQNLYRYIQYFSFCETKHTQENILISFETIIKSCAINFVILTNKGK